MCAGALGELDRIAADRSAGAVTSRRWPARRSACSNNDCQIVKARDLRAEQRWGARSSHAPPGCHPGGSLHDHRPVLPARVKPSGPCVAPRGLPRSTPAVPRSWGGNLCARPGPPARRSARVTVGEDHAAAAMGFDHPVAELLLVKPRIQAALGEELFVGAALDDRAVLDGEDDVGAANRGKPMGDGDRPREGRRGRRSSRTSCVLSVEMPPSRTVARLIGPPQAAGEYVALRIERSDEEIVHLHDYERIYRVPGLYEHIVQDLLGCRSPQAAADGLADALIRLEITPAEIVLLDLGAGTGIVGELVRELGVPTVIGVDSLEAARSACLRDRADVYHDYLVGDLAAPSPDFLALVRRHQPTALISAGAFGGAHAPPAALLNALELLPTGAPVVFTIDERWMLTDDPGEFRPSVTGLLDSGELRLLERSRFQDRLSTSGWPIHYELIVAAKNRA